MEQEKEEAREGPEMKYRKCEEKREEHNSNKRLRRAKEKEGFDFLKESIPTIANEKRVSKEKILNSAIEYNDGLEPQYTQIRREKKAQLERRGVLEEQVKMLNIHRPY